MWAWECIFDHINPAVHSVPPSGRNVQLQTFRVSCRPVKSPLLGTFKLVSILQYVVVLPLDEHQYRQLVTYWYHDIIDITGIQGYKHQHLQLFLFISPPPPHISLQSTTLSASFNIIMSAYPGQIAPDPNTTRLSENTSSEVREPSEVVEPRKVHDVAQQGRICETISFTRPLTSHNFRLNPTRRWEHSARRWPSSPQWHGNRRTHPGEGAI